MIPFFAQLNNDDVYTSILEQQFILKWYGKLSLAEQNSMTSEDRKWWEKRIAKQIEEEHKKAQKGS